jgi:hypothetical protein
MWTLMGGITLWAYSGLQLSAPLITIMVFTCVSLFAGIILFAAWMGVKK